MRVRLLYVLKLIPYLTAGVLIVAILWLSVNFWLRSKVLNSSTMTCDAIVNIYNDGNILSLRMKFIFMGSEGSVSLTGVLRNNEKPYSQINRHVFFNYKRIGDGFYLENKKTTVSLLDNTPSGQLENFLPAFYSQQWARNKFLIYRQKPAGYIFIKNFMPAFYCAEQ